jgi:hypothetical protein
MKYTFVANMNISVHVEVEADMLKDAIELAQQSSIMGLCHQCARGTPGEWSTSGELDGGTPDDFELVEVFVDDEPDEGALNRAKAGWK